MKEGIGSWRLPQEETINCYTRVEATMRMEAASSLLVLQTGSGTSPSTSWEDAHAGKLTQNEPVTTTSVGRQTETTMSSISNLEEGHARLTKEKISTQMIEQSLQGNDNKVKFYIDLAQSTVQHITPSTKEYHLLFTDPFPAVLTCFDVTFESSGSRFSILICQSQQFQRWLKSEWKSCIYVWSLLLSGQNMRCWRKQCRKILREDLQNAYVLLIALKFL